MKKREQAIYLAGVIDGRAGISYGKTPCVSLRMTGLLPKKLHRIFGGSYFQIILKMSGRRRHWLKLYGAEAIRFLEFVTPFLDIHKKASQRIIAEWQNRHPKGERPKLHQNRAARKRGVR